MSPLNFSRQINPSLFSSSPVSLGSSLNFFELLLFSTIIVVIVVNIFTLYAKLQPHPVYLIDHACFKPGSALEVSHDTLMNRFVLSRTFTEESLVFLRRMLERSGIGPTTSIPESFVRIPPNLCMATAREEAEMVVLGVVDNLLAKTRVKIEEVGVLVVNCSLFSPVPSLAQMIVNRYGLPEDAISYNLSGMGCSSGLVSIDVVKQLLQVHPDKYALVVSTENMTLNGYFGNNRSMLLPNTLFRVGGAAVLLSNRRSDLHRAKYQLTLTVRTHKGADDRAYPCVFQDDDIDGNIGVALSKDLMTIAGEALKANITTLGPLVLPISEQLLFLKSLILKKLFHVKVKPYIPNFKLAFEHFCIHAGGRAVLDQMEKILGLSTWHIEPSRRTLYEFGNTSSSSLWYEIDYCEANGRIKKGDRVWMLGFGSSFKCNSAVWRALKTVEPTGKEKPLMDD